MEYNKYLIEADELLTKVNNPNIRIFDATIMFNMGMSPEEAAKMPTAQEMYLQGHISGAAFFKHLDFSDTESSYEYMLAPDKKLAHQIGKIGIDNDSEVIVYATNLLATATRAWWLLRYAGVENVRVLNGGLNAWKEADGTVEQEARSYPTARFEPKFHKGMLADKEEVQAATERDDVTIQNSLMHDWHDDEHIPGSTCLPLTDLTIGWDAFLPADQLAERLSGNDRQKRIITYCGGGVAATLNAMAYVMNGFENVAIYDGSLYEWIGEGLPVASNK
jgi:thiosulfate/3-mercaptopyruvate sulfurtransferase